MIKNIHHVQITVPVGAESEARHFYCEVLGLQEIEKPAVLKARGGFWLAVGTQQIHVAEENGIPRELSRAHVAYQVDDMEAWRSRLSEAGCKIKDGEMVNNLKRFELRDPFGNRIELVQELE